MSCDRYSIFRNHMIMKYAQTWPDHPFTFRIPYQHARNEGMIGDARREFVRTPEPIRDCVLTLIADLPDDEWVYWCIDDKYPVELDAAAFAACHEHVRRCACSTVSGILLCRTPKLRKRKNLDYADVLRSGWGDFLIGRPTYKGIWLHQFLRVSVLRELFESFPGGTFPAKAMDAFKERVRRAPSRRLFVTHRNHAVFGESTRRGKITANCAHSLAEHGLVANFRRDDTGGERLIGSGRPARLAALRERLALALRRPRRA